MKKVEFFSEHIKTFLKSEYKNVDSENLKDFYYKIMKVVTAYIKKYPDAVMPCLYVFDRRDNQKLIVIEFDFNRDMGFSDDCFVGVNIPMSEEEKITAYLHYYSLRLPTRALKIDQDQNVMRQIVQEMNTINIDKEMAGKLIEEGAMA